MKKTRDRDQSQEPGDEMLPEYRFDYRKARPNRFAGKTPPGQRQVLLDADVATVFTTPEAVNAVLRALIATLPKQGSSQGDGRN
jgi:hypothetical protein